MEKTIAVSVRGIDFELMGYTRSLELCARMNYETENLDFIDQMKPGEVFYDLGACEGRFSIYAAMKGMRVFSFEPEFKNFKVLTENLQLNDLTKRVSVYKMAVGESGKTGLLRIGQPWEGGHQKIVQHEAVREDLNFDFIDEESIEIVSLDDFREENGLPAPNFLKIDIDGSEIPFLRGSAKTLSNSSLKRMIFELDKADRNFKFIIEKLRELKFQQGQEYKVPNENFLFNIIFFKVVKDT